MPRSLLVQLAPLQTHSASVPHRDDKVLPLSQSADNN
jgi:hypothetical protein